ncbi:MAG TPA: ATP-binding cassette domain-containing protein [Nocardioides sp.]|nr:ATP-binding cassette domain-containing protein [Nocardioides sp.]
MTAVTTSAPLIACEGLVRIYKRKGVEVVALQGLELHVEAGEMVAIVGASGSGKSTLLNILAGLDTPSAGRARVADHDLLTMNRRSRRQYRLHTCGFVWQRSSDNLLPYLDAVENVALPQRLAGRGRHEAKEHARRILEDLGMADVADSRPGVLSGGQRQRLAVAVGLANRPQVLFCDEPTGELDSAGSAEVYDALRTANERDGTTVVVVTHDPAVATQVRRTVALRDGRTSTETLRHHGGGDHDPASAHRSVQEYAVLDSAGRLQLPQGFVDELGLHRRVRVELVEDHIEIWPPHAHHDTREDRS